MGVREFFCRAATTYEATLRRHEARALRRCLYRLGIEYTPADDTVLDSGGGRITPQGGDPANLCRALASLGSFKS